MRLDRNGKNPIFAGRGDITAETSPRNWGTRKKHGFFSRFFLYQERFGAVLHSGRGKDTGKRDRRQLLHQGFRIHEGRQLQRRDQLLLPFFQWGDGNRNNLAQGRRMGTSGDERCLSTLQRKPSPCTRKTSGTEVYRC